MNYFYAAQLRQYRIQFMRAFSNLYVDFGTANAPILRRVPCRYGDASRIAESVVRGNSENKVLSTPFISCMINGLAMAPNRRQDPTLVEKVQVNERKYDEEAGAYTSDIGNRYTVERYMPVPYDLTMQVDVWTSNLDQKEQLMEQILMLYNPSIDIQTSTNPIDWTFLTYIEMQENITYTSRSIPMGTENPIDVFTMTFKVPIFINPPAKVKRQSIIQEIVTNIIQGSRNENDWEWSEYEFMSRVITTPGDHSIRLNYTGDGTYEAQLLQSAGDPDDPLNLPTVTSSIAKPTLIPGTAFSFNGVRLDVNTSNLATFADNARMALTNTPYSVLMHNKNSLRFVNDSGLDNTFNNIVGSPLEGLGLMATTYPGGKLAWWRLFEAYGTLNTYSEFGNNASQMRIKKNDDLDVSTDDILGWIDLHPTDQNRIIWKVDQQTMPLMTLAPITAIVDPEAKGPNRGLAPPVVGQRYLLIGPIAEQSVAWGTVNAKPNDIIEFVGGQWIVTFNSEENASTTQYVTNLYTGKIYMWFGGDWSLYIDQKYDPGYWRLAL